MLTKKMLEDAARCGKTKCTECLNRNTCCASGMKVAVHDLGQTALTYRAMLEKARNQFDKYARLYGSIGSIAIIEEIDALLKEV